jgi:ketosteroid isomerase-like protein
MKIPLSFLPFLFAAVSFGGEERVSMSSYHAPEEETVKNLVSSMSSACSNKDFKVYMACFTPQRASLIRKRVEEVFICHDLDMEVEKFFIMDSSDDSITFGVRYVCIDRSSAGKTTFSSKIVAKNCDGSWKIDSEQVKDARHTPPPKAKASPVNFNIGCVGGQCPAPGGAWRKPIRENGGEEAWLPADIGYMPGPSCANGNCAVR